MFAREAVRLLRMRHVSLPALLGHCLEPRAGRVALLVERVLPLAKAVHDDAGLAFRARLNLALSAARMLQFWEAYRARDGRPAPRFFWDLKANNLAVDTARQHVKVLDVESFTSYVPVASYHSVPARCERDEQCVPSRLVRFHDPRLRQLSEMQCSRDTQRCDGTLDARTNVFRVCLVVVAPLLSRAGSHSAPPPAVADDVRRLLARCLEHDAAQRATATELRLDAARGRGRGGTAGLGTSLDSRDQGDRKKV